MKKPASKPKAEKAASVKLLKLLYGEKYALSISLAYGSRNLFSLIARDIKKNRNGK